MKLRPTLRPLRPTVTAPVAQNVIALHASTVPASLVQSIHVIRIRGAGLGASPTDRTTPETSLRVVVTQEGVVKTASHSEGQMITLDYAIRAPRR